MKALSRFKFLTVVQVSLNTIKVFVIFLSLVFAVKALAETDEERTARINADARVRAEDAARERRENRTGDNSCDRLSRDFREQWRKVTQYCSSTGERPENCRTTVLQCQDKINDLISQSNDARSSQGGWMNTIFQTAASSLGGAMGTALSNANDPGAGLRGLSQGCPRLTGRDYQERKRNAEKDLRDAEKDLKEAEKKISEAQKKLGEDSVKIQERLQEANAKFEEEKKNLTNETREAIQQQQRQQAELAQRIRTTNMEALQLRAQLTQAMRAHATSMVSYSESVFRRSCMREVEKMRQEIYGNRANNGQNQGNFLKAGIDRRKDLQSAYDTCLSKLDQEKAQQIETARAQQQQIQQQIEMKEADLTQLNEDVAAAQQEANRVQNELSTNLNDKQKQLVETIQRLQQELTNLQNNTQTELRNINAEIQRIQNRINVARIEIASLGPEPADSGSGGGSSGTSYSEAAGALGEATEISNRFRRTCGNRECSGTGGGHICTLGDSALGGSTGEGGSSEAAPAAGGSTRQGAAAPAANPTTRTGGGRPGGTPRPNRTSGPAAR